MRVVWWLAARCPPETTLEAASRRLAGGATQCVRMFEVCGVGVIECANECARGGAAHGVEAAPTQVVNAVHLHTYVARAMAEGGASAMTGRLVTGESALFRAWALSCLLLPVCLYTCTRCVRCRWPTEPRAERDACAFAPCAGRACRRGAAPPGP